MGRVPAAGTVTTISGVSVAVRDHGGRATGRTTLQPLPPSTVLGDEAPDGFAEEFSVAFTFFGGNSRRHPGSKRLMRLLRILDDCADDRR